MHSDTGFLGLCRNHVQMWQFAISQAISYEGSDYVFMWNVYRTNGNLIKFAGVIEFDGIDLRTEGNEQGE